MKPVPITLPDDCTEIALCGGPYNNFAAVEAFLRATQSMPLRFCLGDMGGFGPHPNRTLDLIRNSNLRCIQGNYDHAVGHGERECGCGYLDPLDRKFAQISFDYTLAHTSDTHRAWLRDLPPQMELSWRGKKIRLCHGSPFEVNEFVWSSETSTDQIAGWLKDLGVQGICGTHSGLPWIRNVEGLGFWMNVGVLGRPAHEGKPHVYYGILELSETDGSIRPKLMTLSYDSTEVIREMRSEGLPEEFCRALETGTWTTCYNILPPAERSIQDRLAETSPVDRQRPSWAVGCCPPERKAK